MNDTSLINLLATVDRGEVEAGTLAAGKATNADVKAYARMMVDAHRKDLDATQALMRANKIAIADSALSGSAAGVVSQAKAKHQESMTALRDASGAAFDRAYIDAMAAGHQDFLATLQKNEGGVTNDAVKKHLDAVQKVVADHLARAATIQGRLSTTAIAKPGA